MATANTRRDITKLHYDKGAVEDQVYTDEFNVKYVGEADGTIRQIVTLQGDISSTELSTKVDQVAQSTAAQVQTAVNLSHRSGSEVLKGDVTGTVEKNVVTSVPAGVVAHGTLTGLSSDDHPQYMLLAGRALGQTLIGGTGIGEDITFQTTSNAVKGSYIFSEMTIAGVLKNTALGVVTGGNTVDIGDISFDHGDLGGLADDDHLQYHTDARGDIRYLLLDTSNDPLTNTLDGANFDFTGTGQIDTSLTVGTGTATDGLLRYHSSGVLVNNIGWSEANTALIISGVLFNGSDDLLSFTATEIVFNDSAQDINQRFEGTGVAELLVIDAGGNRVLVGLGTGDSLFHVGGSVHFDNEIKTNITTVTTTSHTAAAEHIIRVDDDTAGSTVTVTLPAASGNDGLAYHIKKLGTTANVIVDGNVAETIDGALTQVLAIQYDSIMVVSNGTGWDIH